MWITLTDLRTGWRALRRHPLVSGVAVISLALAIGANTAIFSVWDAIMRQQLPVQQPLGLVAIYNLAPTIPGLGYMPVSHLDFLDYASETSVFSGAYELYQTPVALGTPGTASQVIADVVSGSYFDVLGVKAGMGALFHANETRADGSGALAVLSYDFFERRFHGNRSIVGSLLSINGAGFTVVGIAPAEFSGTGTLAAPDLWVPVSMHKAVLTARIEGGYMARNAQFFGIVARLRPGVTFAQARSAVALTGQRLAREYPKTDALLTATALPLLQAGIDPNRRPLFSLAFVIMLAVVGMVLLIACANIANLLMARAFSRRREMAVRLALGASRAQLARQLLSESVLLAAPAGAAGALLAAAGQSVLWNHRPAALQTAAIHLSLSTPVLAFTLAITLLTTVLFGLAPALLASRVEPLQALRGVAGATGNRPARINLLLVTEAGFSITVLILTGLFLASLRHLQSTAPGFDTAQLAALQFDLASTGFKLSAAGAPAKLLAFDRSLIARVRHLPGVAAATLAAGTPMAAVSGQRGYQTFPPPSSEQSSMRVASIESIAPGSFFTTMRIPLLAGRDFSPTDGAAAARVMIVNQTFARTAWPGQNPLGKRILFHDENTPTTVVGVARDSTYTSLGEPPVAFAYLPLAQEPSTALGLAVRSAGPPAAVLQELRNAVEAANPELAITHLQPASDALSGSLWAPRMGTILLALLSVLATLLAAIGVYGVAAYDVRQQRRELGIRMALGAGRGHAFRSVLRRGLTPVLFGAAIGIAAASILGRLAGSLLFGVGAANAGVVVGYTAFFVAVACLALLPPAHSATKADPASVLKDAL